MATTYCEQSDIEAIISVAGLLACIDDDEDGAASSLESAHVTAAIERAAVEINTAVRRQYVLADVTDNDWLKHANAALAAYYLQTRRGNPAWPSLSEQVGTIREYLGLVAEGRRELPEQAPSFDHLPTVSNFRPEIGKAASPIRVSVQESTGSTPHESRKRFIAGSPGPY